jgi:hypothetical protein
MWPVISMLLLGVIGLSHLGAEAATRYAHPTGTGTACTNINTPCNMDTAFSQAQPGDTVFLRGGTYSFTNIKIIPCGLPGQPVTVRNYQNEVAISHRPGPNDRPKWNLQSGDCGYIDIIGSYDAATDTRGIVMDGVELRLGTVNPGATVGMHHVNIKNFESKNSPQTWMIAEGAHHIHLDNVELHHA